MYRKYFNEKLTIGFISNTLNSDYQQTIWSEFIKKSKENDVNTLCFSGGDDPYRNKIYELISENCIDGLVIVTSSVCRMYDKNETEAFFKKFAGLPVVSMGIAVKDVPSIIVDNKSGMKSIVRHLIEKHGYRNFSYIGGPAKNTESKERFDTLKEALEEHDLHIDTDMTVYGDFSMSKAYEVTNSLLNQKKYPDVIVAASDSMAIGAINALFDAHILVPDEIAVTGYDDLYAGRYIKSPLTTVSQPLNEMAEKALSMILDILNGRKIRDLEMLKTESVIRRSCGCMSHEIILANKINAIEDSFPRKQGSPDGEDDVIGVIMNDLFENYPKESITQNGVLIENTILSFIQAINENITKDEYIINLDKAFRLSSISDFEKSIWDGFFTVLRKRILSLNNDDPVIMKKTYDLVDLSRIVVDDIFRQNEKSIRSMISSKSNSIQHAIARLWISFEKTNLFNTMFSELKKIGIRSCYLSLFTPGDKEFKKADIILAYNKKGKIDVGKDGLSFTTKEIIPVNLIKVEDRFDLIAESLLYQEELLGFILFEMESMEGVEINPIINQIGSTIKASMLLNEAVQKGKELEAAFSILKENQEKLLISEKMASLGRLAAGIAHEMNSPLAAIRANLFDLKKLIQEYKKSRNEPDFTDEDMDELIEDMSQTVNLADKSTDNALNFIKAIKLQTVEVDRQYELNFNAAEILKKSIFMMNHIFMKNNLTAEFSCENENITLCGPPGRLLQVMTNLISNAVDAMKDKHGGMIVIRLFEDENHVRIDISDQGKGIPDSIITKIFDPMFTTKPFGQATGLGLTLVHDIIYGEFNGKIEVETAINSGTTFKLLLNKCLSNL